jgi:hypothetical protein
MGCVRTVGGRGGAVTGALELSIHKGYCLCCNESNHNIVRQVWVR